MLGFTPGIGTNCTYGRGLHTGVHTSGLSDAYRPPRCCLLWQLKVHLLFCEIWCHGIHHFAQWWWQQQEWGSAVEPDANCDPTLCMEKQMEKNNNNNNREKRPIHINGQNHECEDKSHMHACNCICVLLCIQAPCTCMQIDWSICSAMSILLNCQGICCVAHCCMICIMLMNKMAWGSLPLQLQCVCDSVLLWISLALFVSIWSSLCIFECVSQLVHKCENTKTAAWMSGGCQCSVWFYFWHQDDACKWMPCCMLGFRSHHVKTVLERPSCTAFHVLTNLLFKKVVLSCQANGLCERNVSVLQKQALCLIVGWLWRKECHFFKTHGLLHSACGTGVEFSQDEVIRKVIGSGIGKLIETDGNEIFECQKQWRSTPFIQMHWGNTWHQCACFANSLNGLDPLQLNKAGTFFWRKLSCETAVMFISAPWSDKTKQEVRDWTRPFLLLSETFLVNALLSHCKHFLHGCQVCMVPSDTALLFQVCHCLWVWFPDAPQQWIFAWSLWSILQSTATRPTAHSREQALTSLPSPSVRTAAADFAGDFQCCCCFLQKKKQTQFTPPSHQKAQPVTTLFAQKVTIHQRESVSFFVIQKEEQK